LNNLIDVRGSNHIQAKKFDFVRIAFILHHFGELSCNQINYHYGKIFGSRYMHPNRIAMILHKNKHFESIVIPGKEWKPKTYLFNGVIKLNEQTMKIWNNKLVKRK